MFQYFINYILKPNWSTTYVSLGHKYKYIYIYIYIYVCVCVCVCVCVISKGDRKKMEREETEKQRNFRREWKSTGRGRRRRKKNEREKRWKETSQVSRNQGIFEFYKGIGKEKFWKHDTAVSFVSLVPRDFITSLSASLTLHHNSLLFLTIPHKPCFS